VDKGFYMVVGMSIAYVASLLGMLLAWYSYRRHQREKRK
jgi:hypothetical protein